ncbi:uncharacterized protein MICPUCDRAFT_52503 [Micromonas pusilla CCMP1545]|uniref:Predicted protein n=1 Tax=Micromonas pusilla (strain CCMP1545) TaxID=564608 RepID=C1N4C7_MICPC|nr:uncharacterized protein MICPUCDRAFT_52503 [Micromonas pusilla CCMP1545]EEH52704.1 predicted protein [Micromonas pusilla CCMP1545]|eukprot:XP_003062765.1 predicted protein [Micromonas pusilla CCMP1545]
MSTPARASLARRALTALATASRAPSTSRVAVAAAPITFRDAPRPRSSTCSTSTSTTRTFASSSSSSSSQRDASGEGFNPDDLLAPLRAKVERQVAGLTEETPARAAMRRDEERRRGQGLYFPAFVSLRPGSLAHNPDTPRRLSTPLLTPFNSTTRPQGGHHPNRGDGGSDDDATATATATAGGMKDGVEEVNGPRGLEPTRFGDWERGGRCSDF